MARAKKSKPDPVHGLSPFRGELERALDHFHDSEWLGTHSPLSAPFLLGDELLREAHPQHPLTRGRVLQRRLQAAARSLPAGADGRYDPARLLHLTYLHANQTMNQAGIALQLGLSPASYYRHRLDALAELELVLARELHPALRLEAPSPPAWLVGRDRLLTACLDALRSGRSVALSGGSGVGKTSLGAAIARAWVEPSVAREHPRVFWYTLRRGLNDQLEAFLFALGHFLRRAGHSALWLQLAANPGRFSPELALGLAREALAAMEPRALVCIDEADVLVPRDGDTAHTVRLRAFLEALAQSPREQSSDLFPLLLLGQQLLIEPDVHHIVGGLAQEEAAMLLDAAGVPMRAADLQRVHELARGNPLLLRLFMALHEGNSSVDDSLRALAAAPTLGLLLQRVQRKLTPEEREALALLCVFRGAAPADLFSRSAGQGRLFARDIVVADDQGGVALPPALRAVASELLTAEDRQRQHLRAAEALAARADFTEAAYHYAEGGQPGLAVHVWYANRAREVERGNGAAALEVFRAVSRTQLRPPERKLLSLVRAELRQLVGDTDVALAELGEERWPADDALTPHAREVQGDLLRGLSQYESAIESYRDGLRALAQQSDQVEARRVALHARLGDAYFFAGQPEAAWNQALRARHVADNFQGIVQEQLGHYETAQGHYAAALSSARQAGDGIAEARAHFQLANLAVHREDTDAARMHFDEAARRYRAVGDVVRVMRCQSNLAAMFILRGEHEHALGPAAEALDFFERVGQPAWVALNAGNLGEAHLGLGHLDEAERYARRALQTEDATYFPYALTVMGLVLIERGNMQDAEARLREAIEFARQSEDRWAEAPACRALGDALAAAGRFDAADQEYARALGLYEALGVAREAEKTALKRARAAARPR